MPPLVPSGPLIPLDIYLDRDSKARRELGLKGSDSVGDQIIDATFQRPEELGFGNEDDVDLPGGSLRHPLGDPNFQGEDRRPFDGRAEEWLQNNPFQAFGGLIGLLIAAAVGFVLLQAFATGIGQGVAS